FDAGRVYVANLGASELGVFARPPATSARPYAGARIATITGGNLSRASSVAVGSDGNLYVVDSFQGRIAAFAPAGAFLGNVGSYGDGLGQLELPVDAAATPGGHLLVTSTRTGRVESYALQGAAPLTCPGDSDCDGMPDWWEIAHGLDPFNPADAFLDPDGDGLTNLDEYRLGTDPHKWDTDGDGISDGAEVRAGTNPLDPSDNRPAASAGTSLATDPTLVQLDGGGSHDPNGDLLTHEWRQVSGPATLALEGADKARVRFVARQAGDYVLALRVRDPNVWSPDATVTVTVRDVAPTADAGPDVAARVGDAVALDGRFSSDANGSVLSFAWTQASGPAAVLSDPAAPVASFVPAQAGVYAFDLVVNDGVQSSAPARVVVVADAPGDHVPVALAARPPEGFAGAPVVLDGTRSLDLDGDPLAYAWTQLSGPVVALDGAARAVASFTPPQPGLYRFALAVSDARHESPPDVVTVVVGGPSSPARASVATPMRGAVLQPVTVSGLLSYGDAATLAFAWSQRAGPHVPFDVSAPVLAFTPIEPGTYEFELQVSDASGAGTITRFAIPVDGPGNTVPVAAASASASVTGEPAQLDAGASFDPDGAVLGYAWAQTGGPRVPLSSPRAPAPTFVPSVPGTYEFELRVDDGALRSPAARVALAVGTPLDYPPIAVAADLVARAGDGAVLDGSGSVDPESRPITYLWTQVSGPAGVTLSGADTPLPAVAGLVSGYSYRFDLVVNDGANASLPAAVHVSAVDVPLANAHVMGPARVSVAHAGSVLDGAAVDVPAGALPGWSWIAVGEVTRAWYAAEGRSPVGPALFVGPVGVPLSSPLTITVPLPAGFSRPAKAQTLRVSGFDYAGNAWVDVPAAVDTDSRTVRFEGGFGTYQLTAPGDAGGGGSAGRSGCGTAGTGTPLDLVAAIGALLLWAGFRRRRASAPCGEVVRMDTRHAKARAILAAVALASAGSVAAVDTPHWGATNASGCQGCHQIHNAPGLALTNQAGNENVCFQCHASSGWASTQQASPGAGTGSSHRWDAVVATSPYATTPTNAGCPPSDTGCVTKRIDAAGKLMCSTCHDQHGGGNEPFTPFATSYTSGTGTGRKFMRMPNNAGQLCGACHYDRQTAAATDLRTWDGGTKSHPVGAGKTLGTRDPTLYNTVPLDVNGAVQVNAGSPDADGNVTNNVVLLNTNKASYTQGEVVCLTCHAVHFADSSSATADTGPTAAGDGNLLRRSFRVGSPTAAAPADADDACTGCHKARQHSSATTSAKYGTWSKTCRDCHEGHGTSNLLLVKGTLNSKTISLRQLSAGDASTGGTAANDLADAAGNGPCEACHTQTKDARAAGAQPRFRTTGLGANGMHFTKNCTACHSHLNGFVGRESAGGENCYPCHSYGMRSADASRTSTYHHVIESDVAAAYTLTIGAPTSAVPTLATADGDKRCTQCHVDHPFGANRATNLRTGIGTGP
ncbi:MAG TPA: cytochrome c3 family protein, partial [Anaeromyxobacter sp.]